jgi:hypothetical protein
MQAPDPEGTGPVEPGVTLADLHILDVVTMRSPQLGLLFFSVIDINKKAGRALVQDTTGLVAYIPVTQFVQRWSGVEAGKFGIKWTTSPILARATWLRHHPQG